MKKLIKWQILHSFESLFLLMSYYQQFQFGRYTKFLHSVIAVIIGGNNSNKNISNK